MRERVVLICLTGLIIAFMYLTLSYLSKFTLGFLAYSMGLTNQLDDGRRKCVIVIVAFSSFMVSYLLYRLLQSAMVVEGVLARFLGDRGIFYDFVSTLIQWGRFLYYERDIYLSVYISIIFLAVVMFFDMFARRQDTNLIARKVAKRCFYGALILVYQKEMFDYFPGALVPLVPALFAGYILLRCSDDLPQHMLVPNWFNWRSVPFHADTE